MATSVVSDSNFGVMTGKREDLGMLLRLYDVGRSSIVPSGMDAETMEGRVRYGRRD